MRISLVGLLLFIITILAVSPAYTQDVTFFVPEGTYISFNNGELNYLPVYSIQKNAIPPKQDESLAFYHGTIEIYLPGGKNLQTRLDEPVTIDDTTFHLRDYIKGSGSPGFLIIQQPHPSVDSFKFISDSYLGMGNEELFLGIIEHDRFQMVREILKEYATPVNLNTVSNFRANYAPFIKRQSFIHSEFLQENTVLLRQELAALNLAVMGTETQGQSAVIKLPSNDLLIVDTGQQPDFIHIRNEINRNIIHIIKNRFKPYTEINLHFIVTQRSEERIENLKRFLETDVYKPNFGYLFMNMRRLESTTNNPDQESPTALLHAYLTEEQNFQVHQAIQINEQDALVIYKNSEFWVSDAFSRKKTPPTSDAEEDWGLTHCHFPIDPVTKLQFTFANEVHLQSDLPMITSVIHKGYRTLFLSDAGEFYLRKVKEYMENMHAACSGAQQDFISAINNYRSYTNGTAPGNPEAAWSEVEALQSYFNSMYEVSLKTDTLIWPGNALYSEKIHELMDELLTQQMLNPAQIIIPLGKQASDRDNLLSILPLIDEHNRARMAENDWTGGINRVIEVYPTIEWDFTWQVIAPDDSGQRDYLSIENPIKTDIRYYS